LRGARFPHKGGLRSEADHFVIDLFHSLASLKLSLAHPEMKEAAYRRLLIGGFPS
jgi:hypothetical protein